MRPFHSWRSVTGVTTVFIANSQNEGIAVVRLSQIHDDSVLQHIAMALWMRHWPRGVMALVTSYFDASGSPDGEPFLVLGGLISTVDKWISFSEEWKEILDVFEVPALHMRDFAHSEGDFSSWRWDEPRRIRFISALITVMEKHVEYSVAAAVSMRDYRAVDKNYQLSEFMRPYSFAASTSSGAIPAWARSMGYDPDSIAHVFEKGDTDQSDLQRSWEALFPDLKISPIFYRKRDYHPDPNVCSPIRPFEAADLIAYENFKGNVKLESRGTGTIYLDELRKPLQRFLRNLPGAKQWLYSQRREIEAVCSEYKVQLRPAAIKKGPVTPSSV